MQLESIRHLGKHSPRPRSIAESARCYIPFWNNSSVFRFLKARGIFLFNYASVKARSSQESMENETTLFPFHLNQPFVPSQSPDNREFRHVRLGRFVTALKRDRSTKETILIVRRQGPDNSTPARLTSPPFPVENLLAVSPSYVTACKRNG